MSDVTKRYDRFMSDPTPIRLGGIAANLARIASFAGDPRHHNAVLDLIEESKWFIEWAAPEADLDVAARLVEMQISLALIEARMHDGRIDVNAMIQSASTWSEEVLQMSGLLD